MSLQQIPVGTAPNQNFAVSLTVDGAPLTLNLSLSFNRMAGVWMLSVADSSGNPLVSSLPLITGTYPAGNLLQQQGYLRIGSVYAVNASNATRLVISSLGYGQGGYGDGPYGGALGFGGSDYPDDTNLGTDFQLWWGDTPVN